MCDISYFIDGTMGFIQVGHVQKAQESFPILLRQIVASRGKLENGSFNVDDSKHLVVLVYPEDLDLRVEDKCTINETIKNTLKSFGEIIPECVPYPNLSKDTSSKHKQAKEAIMDIMKKTETMLLKDGLEKNKDGVYYKDGELEDDGESYLGMDVISLCKKLSVDSLARKVEEGEKKLIEEIAGLNDDKNYTSLYKSKLKKNWWIWYLKLRNANRKDKDHVMSDVIQCTIESETTPSDSDVGKWVERLKQLAYPTCYGLDRARWRTHIYHIYLTELFCKMQSINQQAIEYLVYGNK